jgi:uncharacterized protein (DUF1501 family)
MNMTRRAFLKSGGVAALGLGAMPLFLRRAVAATPMPNKKILVVLFQRGAADGLNIVVPFAEKNYYRIRPSIAIPQPKSGTNAAIDLDGFFGLHPSLSSLAPLYRQGQLAIVHAAGSPDTTRSHFDAQDYMESGTPGVKSGEDGWLNRYLQANPSEHTTPFRAVAVDQILPRTLRGAAAALALPDVKQFQVVAPSPLAAGGFEAMYAQTVDHALHGTSQETFAAIDMLRKANPARFQPENGSEYPKNRMGHDLLQIAQLIKADIGVEAAFLEVGGWDHHVNEGGVEGQLSNLLRGFGDGLAAFHRDLGGRMENIVLVSMSEFGRTAHENGNRGTDHGHANCMFVMGGPVQGGKVYGRWPGLEEEQLNEGRDLTLTTDFRTVLGELVSRHLCSTDLKKVFPGFNGGREFLGILQA